MTQHGYLSDYRVTRELTMLIDLKMRATQQVSEVWQETGECMSEFPLMSTVRVVHCVTWSDVEACMDGWIIM